MTHEYLRDAGPFRCMHRVGEAPNRCYKDAAKSERTGYKPDGTGLTLPVKGN